MWTLFNRVVGLGASSAEGGADCAKGEAENGKDAEAEDQGIWQVGADGGHQFAIKRLAVDGVST